ncbi:MAG: alanine racemase [Bacillota bacterium]|jgi:alanine racemase
MQHLRPTWAEIDLDNLIHNIGAVRRILPDDCEIFGVVKADAYGHGAVRVAQTALAAGANRLAVSIVDEAWELRKAGIAAPILILGYTPAGQGELAARLGLSVTVYDRANAESLAMGALRAGRQLKVHLKIDTGMSRLGVAPPDAARLAQYCARLPGIELEGVFTHFARADEADITPTCEQLRRFQAALRGIEATGIQIPLVHAANSASAIRFPDTRFNAIRLGLSMYGLYPDPLLKDYGVELRPAMSLRTTVSFARWVPANTAVSYGGRHITEAPAYLVTLPIGYADGLSRLLSGKAEVLLRGRRVPLVGTICMDQCVVDATQVADAVIGDEVVIWGRQGDAEITVDEVAQRLGTISYEVLCLLSKRVPRVYFRQQKIVDVRNLLG